jgi:hypothetical protein
MEDFMERPDNRISALRLKESGDRDASVLENGCLRVMTDDEGGMVPELSLVPIRALGNSNSWKGN